MFWAKPRRYRSAGLVLNHHTLLTYASLSAPASPWNYKPLCPQPPSSCIIASCLLVAAGASQWPRYNEGLWPSAPAACSVPTPPPATSLPSLPSLHDPHLHGYRSKMAPRERQCSEGFLDHDSWLQRSRVRGSSRVRSADNSLRIRAMSFTHPLFLGAKWATLIVVIFWLHAKL